MLLAARETVMLMVCSWCLGSHEIELSLSGGSNKGGGAVIRRCLLVLIHLDIPRRFLMSPASIIGRPHATCCPSHTAHISPTLHQHLQPPARCSQ